MKFADFVRKNQNVITSTRSTKISESIPISEARQKFYTDEQFTKYDVVESEGKKLRILEKCSNYYACVDESGNIVRKFANALTLLEHNPEGKWTILPLMLHGYTPSEAFQNSKACEKFIWAVQCMNEDTDDIALLKELKEADKKVLEESMETDYKLRDKLTIAKLIADAVGIPHDPASTPENLVNAAIRKARKDPALMRNKAVLTNMLEIAKSVGIRFSDTTFEVKEDVLNEDPLNAWKNRMKAAGAVHYISGKHASGTTASKLHAYKIVDGKKVKVGAFDQVGRRGISEDTLDEGMTKEYHHRMYLKAIKLGNGVLAKHHAQIRDSLKEEILDELNIDTVKSYSDKVKTAPAKSMDKAIKRFGGQERAQDRIHRDELKKMTDRLKESEEVEPLTLKSLRKKMDLPSPDENDYAAKNKEMMGGVPTDDTPDMPDDNTGMTPDAISFRDIVKKLNATMVPKSEVSTPSDQLPHGNAMNPTSNTHRKQLIKKLQGN